MIDPALLQHPVWRESLPARVTWITLQILGRNNGSHLTEQDIARVAVLPLPDTSQALARLLELGEAVRLEDGTLRLKRADTTDAQRTANAERQRRWREKQAKAHPKAKRKGKVKTTAPVMPESEPEPEPEPTQAPPAPPPLPPPAPPVAPPPPPPPVKQKATRRPKAEEIMPDLILPDRFAKNPDFIAAWTRWVEHRLTHRSPYQNWTKTFQMQLQKLERYTPAIAIETLDRCSTNCYQGIIWEIADKLCRAQNKPQRDTAAPSTETIGERQRREWAEQKKGI